VVGLRKKLLAPIAVVDVPAVLLLELSSKASAGGFSRRLAPASHGGGPSSGSLVLVGQFADCC